VFRGLEDLKEAPALLLDSGGQAAVVERALDHVFRAPPSEQVVIDLRLLTFLDTAGLFTPPNA